MSQRKNAERNRSFLCGGFVQKFVLHHYDQFYFFKSQSKGCRNATLLFIGCELYGMSGGCALETFNN